MNSYPSVVSCCTSRLGSSTAKAAASSTGTGAASSTELLCGQNTFMKELVIAFRGDEI